MRLGGRLAAAIEVLGEIERLHRPAAEALKDWGLSHRFAGAGDRAVIGNIVYDALRRRRSAAWLFDSDTPRALAFGAAILETGLAPEEINDRLDSDRFAPSPLAPGELDRLARGLLAAPPDGVRADCPDWCQPRLERALGPAWAEEAHALALRPPLDMRVNTLKAERAKVVAALERAGAAPCAIAAEGIRIPPIAGEGRHPNVQAEPAFNKGWFEVQDEGSQIVTQLAGAEAGMQVLDFCAGSGGKTLALSAMTDNRGQVHAHDAQKQRIAPIFGRLKRAGCRNVQVVTEPADLAALEGRMDLVLVDAPCTGSGTWRRRPDAKWRLTGRQLEMRRREQAAILDAAARHVRPGGRLAYVTCSVFAEENGDQVAAFLERAPGFRPADHAALWRGRYPGHPEAARIDSARGILLTPYKSATDGFFFAGLTRNA